MSRRAWLAVIVVVAVAVAGVLVWRARQTSVGDGQAVKIADHPLEALAGASGWINGDARTPDSLKGAPVVLVVWSDTDPVSMQRLRDAQVWQDAYGRFDLRVIGVHEPEYAFATDSLVPAQIMDQLNVRFPVALDAGRRIGSQLGAANGLPVWLVVDVDGSRVAAVHGDRLGSVNYALLDLLSRKYPGVIAPVEPPGEQNPPTVKRVYLGSTRVTGGPLVGAAAGRPQTFTAQFRYQEEGEPNTPYVVGRWTPGGDGLTSARGGASDYVALRFLGGDVSAVMSSPERPHRVWVLCDDAWLPDSLSSEDVRRDSRGASFVDVAEPRIYTIAHSVFGHVLKLSPEAPGVTFYDFSIVGP